MIDDLPEFDEETLRASLMNLKKFINSSKQIRYENPKNPELWIDVEISIEKSVRKISVLAAYPQMIQTFISVEGVQLLFEVLDHPNVTLTLAG
jgi:hypothetical protein